MATSDLIRRYLSCTVTQGGADTFAEAAITTELVPEDGFVYQILAIQTEVQNSLALLSADSRMTWFLSRDTKTTVTWLSDPDVIFSDSWAVSLTTSGQMLVPGTYFYDVTDHGLFIVEPTIYAAVYSQATGLTNVMNWRIYYKEVKVSELDILRILNNR